MFVMDQLSPFTSVRLTEVLFEPFQLYLELPDLLKQPSHNGLAFLLVLALLAFAVQLTGTIQQLALQLTFLESMDGVMSHGLPDRFAATDRPMATLPLNSELWLRRLLIGGSPIRIDSPLRG